MNVRYVGYAELESDGSLPPMRDYLEKEAYPNKKDIIRFLRNGTIELAGMSRDKDIFTGEVIPAEVLIMHHGDYVWANVLAWYVEKYNLRMPKDFEAYILKNA